MHSHYLEFSRNEFCIADRETFLSVSIPAGIPCHRHSDHSGMCYAFDVCKTVLS